MAKRSQRVSLSRLAARDSSMSSGACSYCGGRLMCLSGARRSERSLRSWILVMEREASSV